MKRLICLLFTLAFFFNLTELRSETGKIDMGLAVSLHPSMSLFDFDRMGFFKVAPGLDNESFAAEIEKLKNDKGLSILKEKIKSLEDQNTKLERQRALLHAQTDNVNQKRGEELKEQINQVVEAQEKIKNQIDDLKYQISCPELTSPAETRARLDKIEQEVIETIKAVANEKKLSVVLNNSTPYSTGYPIRYVSGPLFGQGVPGIDYQLFYSFLATRKTDDSSPPSSRDLINWIELTHYPEAVDLLPLKPWPLVIHGGTSILRDVMDRIYKKHNFPQDIIQTLDSVIIKIEEDKSK